MKQITCILIILLVFTSAARSQDSIITLGEANKKGWISIDIKGKGGYTGNVILMKIKNLFSGKRKIKIEAGRRLDSKEQSEQDILIVRSLVCDLNPGDEKELNIYGMCCQMHNAAPQPKSEFGLGEMASLNLVSLANFIDSKSYFESYAAQHAVWVLSDSCRIESIMCSDKNEQMNLQQFVAKILDIPVPWYTLEYAKDTTRLFSNRPVKMFGEIEFSLFTNAEVSMGLYDSKGFLRKQIFVGLAQNPGTYTKSFIINVASLPKGIYYTRIFADGNMVIERKIVL